MLSDQNRPGCGASIAFKELLKHPLEEFIRRISSPGSEKKVIIADEKEEKIIEYFSATLKHIQAFGGLVQNSEGEILLIYRNGKWDLPKGKAENNETHQETAIREIHEECGNMNLEIVASLPTTYHIFVDADRKFVFKECIWYHMITVGKPSIDCQLEEGITEASWVALPVPVSILKGAYPSIRELVNYFQLHYLRSLRS